MQMNTKYLLSFGRVILCVDFEEWRLVVVVVVHPLTEVVSDVKAPGV